MNRRAEVKQKIYDLLVNKTTVGANVFISRVRRFDLSGLPNISIYTPKETAKKESYSSDQYLMSCMVQIDILTELKDNYESELDEISSKVEDILLVQDPRYLVPYSEDFNFVDSEVFLYGSDNRQTLAICTLTFDLTYNANAYNDNENDDPEYPPEPGDTESVELENYIGG